MKKEIVYMASAVLALVSCGRSAQQADELSVIPMEAAFAEQAGLNLSECFKKVRYVPLETTDSSLVGKYTSVQVLNQYIVVTSEDKYCHLFDKQTGRFIRSIGHVGNDPQGYSTVSGGWCNPHTDELAFPGWNHSWVMYGTDGKYRRHWKAPIAATGFPAIALYNYAGADEVVGYYPASDSLPLRIALFKGDETVRVDTLFKERLGELPLGPADIASISVMKAGALIITDKSGKTHVYSMSNDCFWRHDGNLYLKMVFNDTIYSVSPTDGVQPVRVLSLGKHAWPYEERYEEHKEGIYPESILEGNDVMLINFAVGFYGTMGDMKNSYIACYRKSDGSVKITSAEKQIVDDLNGFLPVRPQSVSESGEFAAYLPAYEVAEWFADNADRKDLPADIEALRKVGEEDNPVVVLME